jgi:hypothetical protein
MRRRTADFLQGETLVPLWLLISDIITVLRRARPDHEEKERKTASGRSFKAGV